MRHLKSMWPKGMLASAVLAGLLAIHGAAWAQVVARKDESQPSKPASAGTGSRGSYVFPYVMTGGAIGLGLYALCRPSHRRDRARPEEYMGLGDVATGK